MLMNILLPRIVKTAYRKEPISSFILVVGMVDALMGGIGERWTLCSLGAGIIILALLLRWVQSQKGQPVPSKDSPRLYLPPSQLSQDPLPLLTPKRRHRP
jgi:hypothetical protein